MSKPLVLKLKQRVPTESDEQQWLFQWANTQKHGGLRLSDLLIMIPNGAVLAGDARMRAMQMAKMKRIGFKVGVSDLFLAVPTPHYAGLWLEMKRTELSVTSTEQLDFQAKMRAVGYATAIAKGWIEAKEAIEAYLGRQQRETHGEI